VAARVAGVWFHGIRLTGDGQSGTPGFGSACGLAQEHDRNMRKPLGPLARGCRVCGSAGTRRSGSAVAVLTGVRVYTAPGNVLGCERDRKLACNTTNLTGVTLCDYGTAGGLGLHVARHGEGPCWVAGELHERSSGPSSGWVSCRSAPAWHGLAS
jgi:hypothetical protein